MAERIMPGLGLRSFYDPGQRDWGATVSADLRKLSVLVQLAAISRTMSLPSSGSAGDIYIVPEGAASNAGEIALWDGPSGSEAWVYITPAPGWEAWVADEAARVRLIGAGWVALGDSGEAPVVADGTASRTLALADKGAIIEMTSASANTVTIPIEASVDFAIGALVNVTQAGAGTTTIAAAAGVTLNGVSAGSTDMDARWAGAALYKRAANAWVVQGAVGAVA